MNEQNDPETRHRATMFHDMQAHILRIDAMISRCYDDVRRLYEERDYMMRQAERLLLPRYACSPSGRAIANQTDHGRYCHGEPSE